MMSMSTAYELSGRVEQKRRTRTALVEAAQHLVAQGLSPTVDDAAAAASVSRATAYRYFPNQHLLLAAAHPETSALSLLPPDPPADPAQRLELAVEGFLDTVFDNVEQQRTMLRLSLEASPEDRMRLPLRQGRAIGWFTEALAPLQGTLSADEIHRLAIAVRSAVGIEALVWLTDVAGLSRDEARRTLRWTAAAILRGALAAADD